jgi:hypothetical protein
MDFPNGSRTLDNARVRRFYFSIEIPCPIPLPVVKASVEHPRMRVRGSTSRFCVLNNSGTQQP